MEYKKPRKRQVSKILQSRMRASLSEIEFAGRTPRADQISKFMRVCSLCRRGICTLGCASRIYLENSPIFNKREFAKLRASHQWTGNSSCAEDDKLLGGFCCSCCDCNCCKRKFDAVMESERAMEVTVTNLRETVEPMEMVDNDCEPSFDTLEGFEYYPSCLGVDDHDIAGNVDQEDYRPSRYFLNVDEANYLIKTTGKLAGEQMFSRRIQIEVSKKHFIAASMPTVGAVSVMAHLESQDIQLEEGSTIRASWPNFPYGRMKMFFPRGQYHSVLMFLDVHDTVGEKRCLGICNCRIPKGNSGYML